MKFLHLGDLHIGKRLNNISLLEDQRYILGQILDIAREERPDAVLIAGDVYDRTLPPAEAVTLLDDFLTALAGEKDPGLSHQRQPRFRRASGLRRTAALRGRGVSFAGV